MDSSDFGTVNVALQTSSIQLGLHQACVDMKERYSEELKGKNVMYSYPDAQRQIMEHFVEMTTYKYSLVSALESEEMDVGGLKKLLRLWIRLGQMKLDQAMGRELCFFSSDLIF